jgi:small subunit ribosomal protein S4e
MGNKGGDTRLKRQMAPRFWNIHRKQSQFVPKIKPGRHSSMNAYPLGVILRDVLKVSNTMQEAQKIVAGKKIKVDGNICTEINTAIGLMDVIEFVPTRKAFRFVPKNSQVLAPIDIPEEEKTLKVIKVRSKVMTRGKKLQYGFHDGKTIVTDEQLSVGDSCLVKLPELKIIKNIKFDNGCYALVTRGENAGIIGKIDDIRDGVFSLPKRTVLSSADRSVELPMEIVMTVGSEGPIIRVN